MDADKLQVIWEYMADQCDYELYDIKQAIDYCDDMFNLMLEVD